jgi:hypothetical protein
VDPTIDAKLDALRARVDELEQPAARNNAAFDPELSRRSLLRRLGGVAAGGAGLAVAGNALRQQAASADPGTFTAASTTSAAVTATNTGPGTGVYGVDGGGSGLAATAGVVGDTNGSGPGVAGLSTNGSGVSGQSKNSAGMYGLAGTASGQSAIAGVVGDSHDGKGVAGLSATTTGVYGLLGRPSGRGNQAGVVGDSDDATGVAGISGGANGVEGTTGTTLACGVAGFGGGTGVKGVGGYLDIHGQRVPGTGVYGVAYQGSGFSQIAAVVGDTSLTNLPAVAALSSNGVAVHAQGAVAPIRLVPASGTGAPTSRVHSIGEIYIDSAGAMFVCTSGDGTTVGTWAQVAYGSGGSNAGGGFTALDPTRVCDTRPNTGPGGSVSNNPLNVYAGQTLQPFSDLAVLVAGPIGPNGSQRTVIPAAASAVVLNIAVVDFTAAGNFTVYPADLPSPPNAANLNWPGPQSDGLAALSNSVTVRIGNPSGDSAHRGVKIHNASSGTTDVVVDLAGYYS